MLKISTVDQLSITFLLDEDYCCKNALSLTLLTSRCVGCNAVLCVDCFRVDVILGENMLDRPKMPLCADLVISNSKGEEYRVFGLSAGFGRSSDVSVSMQR